MNQVESPSLPPRCYVCGDSRMARSHLFPAKLMHEIRDGAKYVIGVRGAGRRVGYLQSGEVSRKILCLKHEHETQAFDDAAIRFMRSFRHHKVPVLGGEAWSVQNRKPDGLSRFVHSTIWRHWANWHSEDTGPDFPEDLMTELQDIVFAGAEPFPTMVMHAGRTHDGAEARFALAPSEAKLNGVDVTRFDVGGFAFLMVQAHGVLESPWSEFQTTRDPVVVAQLNHGELRNDPNIMRFIKR